ncbi:MAG: alpha/beta hydrolase, partial [Thermoanaerobaculia bacterium]|nr:alpha/beta hydrolase [Thermoanaerobaculia bacterium]
KPGEEVTFILSLHGGGSYANWQRHYFPLLDYKESHRLVIATPSSPIRVWTDVDDPYLQNIVTSVVEKVGKENIRAFWLAGHSQGGMTSNRILRSDFFAKRVDGWLSLSGGRLGGNPERAGRFGPPRSGSARPAISPEMQRAFAQARALLAELPDSEFSFIYTTGEREMAESGLPADSEWAAKLGCGEQKRLQDVADTKAGYVYDGTRQDPPNPAWGLLPGPGKAAVYRYDGCKPGRVVADVVRLEKGHTEGLEPEVTKTLVELMLEAEGGKIRNLP